MGVGEPPSHPTVSLQPVIETLDQDSPFSLDQYPSLGSINPDPQHCSKGRGLCIFGFSADLLVNFASSCLREPVNSEV